MADQFGASHRQLVKDTNAGQVEAPPGAATTSINVSGRSHTTYGKDQKSDLTEQLLKTAMMATGKVIKRRKEIDYAEGYDRGLEEGFAENEESPLRDALFGKSATLRGAQARIIETDSRNWLNMRMKHLDDDSKQFDDKQYKEYLEQALNASLEDHDDPEVRASIKKSATASFETLARNHSKFRQAWVDMENNQAVEDQMESGVQTMEAAMMYGDEKSQQEAMDATEKMFEKPPTMDREKWLETINRVATNNLANGKDVVLRFAQQKGIIQQMRPEEQRKLAIAKEIYDKKNSQNFHQSEAILLGRITAGDATDAEITAHQAKWPGQVNANVLRNKKLVADEALAKARKEQAEATDAFISGSTTFNDYSEAQKAQAVASHFDAMSHDGLAKVRAEAVQAGTFTGDPSAPFTQQQKEDFMLENPYMFASAAAQHRDVKYPAVTNMGTQMMYDMRNESLTEDDIPGLQKKMEFMEVFKTQMGGPAFQSQFKSKEDAANYAVYSGFVKDVGMHPVNAMRELRRIAEAPEIVMTEDLYDEMREITEDLEDDFIETSEQSQGLEGWWYKTDEFDTTLTDEINTKMQKYTQIYKGDMEAAQRATMADIKRNGVVSNGQFIEGGANVNIRGGSIEDYIRGVNADDRLRSQITNLDLGFAVDTDYSALKVTTDPFNKKNIILHSVHEDTGHPISVVLVTPSSGKDFSTYGVNAITGYNPNLTNRGERINAMTKNGLFQPTRKAIGDITDKALGAL